MLKNSALIALLLCLQLFSSAQEPMNRYVVFLNDKDTSAFSIDAPEAFLSPRSIQRRTKQAIEITPQDFPVNKSYLTALRAAGAEVYFTSKWLNAVTVQMAPTLYSTILSLDFVNQIDLVANGSPLSNTKDEVVIPETFLDPPSVRSNSSLQNNFLGVGKMHEDGFEGQNMMIAIFDNGFRGVNEFKPFQHVFDDNRLVATRDFFGNSGNIYQYGTHGTQVFSCIGARYENTMIGTAPESSFVLCVTEESGGEYRIEEYNWLMAAEYADSLGVDVINSSLGYSFGFTVSSMNYSPEDLDGKTTVISRAANIAATKGMVIVTSAGNEGNNFRDWNGKITAPADSEEVLTVGSVTRDLFRSVFSSFGPTSDGRIKPDVVALGSNAAVVTGSGNITTSSGTSFSSPQIAGFAACVWQISPSFNYQEVIEAIKLSGNNAASPDSIFGYGIPNYLTMINDEVLSFDRILNTDFSVYPNPFKNNQITIDLNGIELENNFDLTISDSKGNAVFVRKISKRNTPDQIIVDFDAESKGVYFLNIQSRKYQKTIKLIKI